VFGAWQHEQKRDCSFGGNVDWRSRNTNFRMVDGEIWPSWISRWESWWPLVLFLGVGRSFIFVQQGLRMTCQDCDHWNLKKAAMSAYGFGRCKLEKPPFDTAREFSASAHCNKNSFRQAGPAVIEARKRALKGNA
jgi:hypothetical protein